MTIFISILSLMVLLVLQVTAWAGEAQPVCETELRFYQRYSDKVGQERDRWVQRVQILEMEKAYLKQRVEQLEKAKTETPQ